MPRLIHPAPGPLSRRELLRLLFWSAGAVGVGGLARASGAAPDPLQPAPAVGSRFARLGPLQAPDANGLRLPAGVSSRVIAAAGETVGASDYRWHAFPDGGATYPTVDGGWVYVSNSEVKLRAGGAGAVRFDREGRIVDAYRVLSGTSSNCAGGKMPWGHWLSCEETSDGLVYECDPQRPGQGTARPLLGRFKHEAATVDPQRRVLYLTEDASSGRLYRFVPDAADWPAGHERPALAAGRLQVLRLPELGRNAYPRADYDLTRPRPVIWEDAADPGQPQGRVRERLGREAPGTVFKGGEGLWYHQGFVYFSTKGDNRIWCHDVAAQTLEVIYDFATAPVADRILSGVDNLTVSEFGDVLVAEDGGDMQVCVIQPDRRLLPLVQVTDPDGRADPESEITGLAFSPDGRRLYFSAQRSRRLGRRGLGITFELLLPA